MEQGKNRDKAPVIAIVAFVLGCICLVFFTVLLLLLLFDEAYQNGQVSEFVSDALLVGFSLLIGAAPSSGVGALITGIIGLKKSKRLSPPSKKGVCFSAIAIAAGGCMLLLILDAIISFFFGGLFGMQVTHPL